MTERRLQSCGALWQHDSCLSGYVSLPLLLACAPGSQLITTTKLFRLERVRVVAWQRDPDGNKPAIVIYVSLPLVDSDVSTIL